MPSRSRRASSTDTRASTVSDLSTPLIFSVIAYCVGSGAAGADGTGAGVGISFVPLPLHPSSATANPAAMLPIAHSRRENSRREAATTPGRCSTCARDTSAAPAAASASPSVDSSAPSMLVDVCLKRSAPSPSSTMTASHARSIAWRSAIASTVAGPGSNRSISSSGRNDQAPASESTIITLPSPRSSDRIRASSPATWSAGSHAFTNASTRGRPSRVEIMDLLCRATACGDAAHRG